MKASCSNYPALKLPFAQKAGKRGSPAGRPIKKFLVNQTFTI